MRFKALDGFRGLCCLLVALYHFPVETHILGHKFFLPHGQMLLDFFFVMSGFIIASAYAGKLNGWGDVGRFAKSRFARLWPLHAATLAFFVAIELAKLANAPGFSFQPAFAGSRPAIGIVTNLLMIQSLHLHPMLTWNFPSWTVSAEFYTYLLFAGAMVLSPRRPVVTACILAVLAGLGVALIARKLDANYDYGFFRCAYGFFCGVLTFRVWKRAPLKLGAATPRDRLRAAGIEGAILLGVFGYIAVLGGGPLGYLGPVAFSAFIWAFASEQGWVTRQFSRPAPVRLGEISYSIYLMHVPVIVLIGLAVKLFQSTTGTDLAAMGFGGLEQMTYVTGPSKWVMDAVMIVYLGLVIGVSTLTFRYIETPGRSLFRRRRPETSAVPVTA